MPITKEDVFKRLRHYERDVNGLDDHKSWLDDVCSNRSSSNEEKQAAQLLLEMVKRNSLEVKNKTKKLRNYLAEMIIQEASHNNIEVLFWYNNITLKGYVNSQEEEKRIVEIAKSYLPGTRDDGQVCNLLTVKSPL